MARHLNHKTPEEVSMANTVPSTSSNKAPARPAPEQRASGMVPQPLHAEHGSGGGVGSGYTAHPKGDPATGELVAMTYEPARRCATWRSTRPAVQRLEPTFPHPICLWSTTSVSLRTSSWCSTSQSLFSRRCIRDTHSPISGIASGPRASASCRVTAIEYRRGRIRYREPCWKASAPRLRIV